MPRNGGHRLRAVLIASATAAALFAGGWGMAREFESPAQKAASASAPASKPVVAEVVRGSLEQDFTATATITRSTRLSAPVQAGSSASYVTGVPNARGHDVRPGTEVLEVDGNPVFALPGRFPFYRDLAVGDTGPDVAQLQRGLAAAGFAVTPDGRFGSGTAAAVRLLFSRSGYAVPMQAASDGGPEQTPTSAPQAPTVPTAVPEPTAPSAPPAAQTTAPTMEPYLPEADLIVFQSLPASLTSVPAVGSPIGDSSVVSVELGTTVGNASIAASVAVSLRTGMTGTAASQGTSVPVTVTAVTQAAASGSEASMLVSPRPGSVFPADWLGQTVLVTIALTTSAKDALIVPTNAIDADASGGGTLLVDTHSGAIREVKIEELGELDGKAAVAPRSGQRLDAGDLVVVG